jgi:hypothetical protein
MPMAGTLEQPPNDENGKTLGVAEWDAIITLNTSMEAPTLMNTTIQ